LALRTIGVELLAIATLIAISGCSREKTQPSQSTSSSVEPSAAVSLNKNDYPVFPNADAGADPSVSAEQGGRGFTGGGWETNTDFDLIGDPRAVKGGAVRDFLTDFPGTLRLVGPEANSYFNYGVTAMAYESLLAIDPNTLHYIPSLATHWQISADQMTYRFRINPNARFSDGSPVTAEDVVSSFDFFMDKSLEDPTYQMTYSKIERPVVESKYIVRVKARELNWRNLLYFSGMLILPSSILKTVNGASYIQNYNFKVLPGSGPYTIREEDVLKGKSITVRRRKDYWAEKARANIGMGNFDELRFVIVRDQKLAFEMFKKGDLDYYLPASAREWVEDTDFETVRRGLVQKRKIYNDTPVATSGFAMNMRREPFDDVRVRKAFALLADRRRMIEKIAYNEYTEMNSHFPGSIYENPQNPRNPFDPKSALNLLAEAGWKDRDSQGRLVKNGKPLEVELLYAYKTWDPHLTIYQEDLRKVGITLNLRLVTPETQFQLDSQHRFQMSFGGIGGMVFPNPETEFGSKLADQLNNNNTTGFKNARLDELCRQYDKMFNVEDRIRTIREIDGIIASEYPWVLLWYGPFARVLYWNKFGMPPGYWSRTGDYFGAQGGPGLLQMWWIDADKQAKLEQAIHDSARKLEVGAVEDRYWLEFDKKHPLK